MRIVKAERWHRVDREGGIDQCSVCWSGRLLRTNDVVLDSTTLQQYRVVRCQGCGYDLLEPVPSAVGASAR
jgi:hypothetical protein